jgi:hypothetical protein
MNQYSVILQFNSAEGGPNKTWTGIVEAESVGEALQMSSEIALKTCNTGGRIYVTGVIAVEIRL